MINSVGSKNNNWRGGKITKNCKKCNKDFQIYPYYKDKKFFCSKLCYTQWQIGKKGNALKNGKYIDKDGYILILQPNHPLAKKNHYIYEHRFIAEKYLNRYLIKSETIHHINGVKDDNRSENLYLFPTHSEHLSWHTSFIRKELKSNLIKYHIMRFYQ